MSPPLGLEVANKKKQIPIPETVPPTTALLTAITLKIACDWLEKKTGKNLL